MKVLIIEDNILLARNISRFFEMEGIKAEVSNDGKTGLEKAISSYFDLIVLDIDLPGINGIDISKHLREKEKNIPILMLTSRILDSDIIKGLNAGADDYLTKPFDLDVLMARVNALTRRSLKNKTNNIKINFNEIIGEENVEIKLEVDLEKNEILKDGNSVKLSSLEFDLLKLLVQNKGKVLTRSEIFDKVWGDFDEYMFSRNVDIYVGYLRKKLGKNLIETKKGVGYLIST